MSSKYSTSLRIRSNLLYKYIHTYIESKPNVKLFRLIALIPMLLLILICLNPLKEKASLVKLLLEVTDVGRDEGEKSEEDIEILGACPQPQGTKRARSE